MWGSVVQGPCGLECGSTGVRVLHMTLKSIGIGRSFTASFWLSTLALDVTFRVLPHASAAVRPGASADALQGLPAAMPVDDAFDRDFESRGESVDIDTLVVAIEDGTVAVGNADQELLRSDSSVADGRWHHVAVVFEAEEATRPAMLTLVLDGVLHGQRPREGKESWGNFTHVSFGSHALGETDLPPLFLDTLGIFPAALAHSALVGLFNDQLLRAAQWGCAPCLARLLPGVASGGAEAASPQLHLALAILSDTRPSSADQRHASRQTWLRLELPGAPLVRHFFCIGGTAASSLLALEAALYGDLLFLPDVQDGYQHLSHKTLGCFRGILQRSKEEFWGIDFLIKTDHDVFLRIDLLVETLAEVLQHHSAVPAPSSPLLYWRGFVYRDVPPMRDLQDKNADVRIADVTFPTYTAGVGYVLSLELLSRIAALPTPVFTLNEDQSLGYWVKEAAGAVQPIHDIRFQQWPVCTANQVALHPSGRNLMRLYALNLQFKLPLCKRTWVQGCCQCCQCDSMRAFNSAPPALPPQPPPPPLHPTSPPPLTIAHTPPPPSTTLCSVGHLV